jgi:hypothetical protein
MNTVLFTFAGRTPNMRLQAPLMRRILEQHPDTYWDVWNLARKQIDAIYLQSLAGPRINVINTFWRNRAYDAIYRHYADSDYKDTLFVKCDDDIVFMQTDRFGEFVRAIKNNPGSVTSALVINNGASARQDPGLWAGYQTLGIPLLKVHEDARFAETCHTYFFHHWREILDRPTKLVVTDDWISINMVGFDHSVMRKMARKVGGPTPRRIAGRDFTPTDTLGDEGAINLFPRRILTGFTAAHLGFGPQQLTLAQEDEWRAGYAQIGADYLQEMAVV